jgi:hypothetical protein
MKHYKYGGSTASRTINCPAWTKLSEDMPKQVSSSFADVGTMLHNAMEDILLNDIPASEIIGFAYKEHEVGQEHIDNKLTPAHEAFKQLCKDYKLTEYEAETTMEQSEDVGGTADFIAAGEDTVIVGDWKFGDGIIIEAEGNAQGMFYAMLARKEIPDLFKGRTKLGIAIIQPTDRSNIDVWMTDFDALDDFEKAFTQAVDLARIGKSEPNPGGHCKWCPAITTCPAKTGLVAKMKRLQPDSLAHDQVADALDLAKAIKQWVKEIEAFAHDQMALGVKFPGWKLVQKQARNKWHDETGALDIVRKAKKLHLDECSTVTLLTPAKLRDLCKKKKIDFKKFEGYCSATSSGTTIVRHTDKRPEYLPTALLDDLAKIL